MNKIEIRCFKKETTKGVKYTEYAGYVGEKWIGKIKFAQKSSFTPKSNCTIWVKDENIFKSNRSEFPTYVVLGVEKSVDAPRKNARTPFHIDEVED